MFEIKFLSNSLECLETVSRAREEESGGRVEINELKWEVKTKAKEKHKTFCARYENFFVMFLVPVLEASYPLNLLDIL